MLNSKYNIPMSKEISYYAEYTDANGHKHYAIHKYNTITGFVTSLRDYKFD